MLIKRWDNAPHHPEIASFPNHLHSGNANVVSYHDQISALDVLQKIVNQNNK